MKLVGKDKLTDFIRKHADARGAVQAWLKEAEKAAWKNTTDIRERYRTASFLENNIVIFNIKGNSYRLVIKVAFSMGIATILYIGTHADYDKQRF